MNLLEIGTPSQFAALRGFLAAAGCAEPQIFARLGLPFTEALDIVTLSQSLAENVAPPESLNTLIRLFLLGEFVPIVEAETQFPGPVWAAMNALGLIEEASTDRKRCFGPVALYPMGDLFICSDRSTNPDHTPNHSIPDLASPALPYTH